MRGSPVRRGGKGDRSAAFERCLEAESESMMIRREEREERYLVISTHVPKKDEPSLAGCARSAKRQLHPRRAVRGETEVRPPRKTKKMSAGHLLRMKRKKALLARPRGEEKEGSLSEYLLVGGGKSAERLKARPASRKKGKSHPSAAERGTCHLLYRRRGGRGDGGNGSREKSVCEHLDKASSLSILLPGSPRGKAKEKKGYLHAVSVSLPRHLSGPK